MGLLPPFLKLDRGGTGSPLASTQFATEQLLDGGSFHYVFHVWPLARSTIRIELELYWYIGREGVGLQ